MACSSESFTVLDYGSCGTSDPIKLELSRGFHPGMVLSIVASTQHRSSFDVKDCHGNILLHVNPRNDQNVVVFNSHQHRRWGTEERPSLMPIKCGVKYHLIISYESCGYRIFINGEEFHFYKHRINHPATTFEINNALVFSLTYKHHEPKWATDCSHQGLYVQEFGACGKQTPHEVHLQNCKPLSWVIVTGIVNHNANRFDVNFINSHGDIVFHFNPRFDQNCVVRNTLTVGKGWGHEEREGCLPFQKNLKFLLAVAVNTDCYRTYVNGQDFVTYNHRLPISLSKIQIQSDVKVLKIVYK